MRHMSGLVNRRSRIVPLPVRPDYTELTVGTDEPDTLGQRIRYWRTKRGLPQKELARRADLTRQQLSHIENDHSVRPRDSTMGRLADGLGVTMQDLEPTNGTPHSGESVGKGRRGAFKGLDSSTTTAHSLARGSETVWDGPVFPAGTQGHPVALVRQSREPGSGVTLETRPLRKYDAQALEADAFGIVVTGTLLERYTSIQAADCCWFNPTTQGLRHNLIVAVMDPHQHLQIRVLRVDGEQVRVSATGDPADPGYEIERERVVGVYVFHTKPPQVATIDTTAAPAPPAGTVAFLADPEPFRRPG
jgi:transcriptional regulator with XRE-family HTH domain